GSAEDDLYFRWLVARYAAYPNVVWDFSKEAHNEKDLEYKLGRLQFLRRNDGYGRLRTVHDDDAANDGGAYDAVVDFRADQHHGNWRAVVLRQRARRAYPVVNVEFGYEHGPGGPEDKTYGSAQSPEEVCRRAWLICMAGGYAAYYYTYTAWDVIRPEDNPPGYALFRHLREIFEQTRYWQMEPAEGVVSVGYCLANPGVEYLVFLEKAEPFVFRPGVSAQPLKAQWMHPFTGERREAGRLSGGDVSLTPPGEWKGAPVVLHARAT
ncbi:MAG: DUF4038 domain-containing protein, partial [Armatimonadota bacterium]|nr:DUF4038 domain-containing protein [Armatimonadota bacterium]